jgi:hypothetical protein
MAEMDPHGKSAHEKGSKLDAGKDRVHLCFSGFARALREVAKVTTYGANKYTPNGWEEVPDAMERYPDAAMRHYTDRESGEKFDRESNLPHLAHLCWNWLATLELELREEANLCLATIAAEKPETE